jgi:hypothetical protein
MMMTILFFFSFLFGFLSSGWGELLVRLESAQIQPTGLHTHFLSNNGSRRKAKRIVIKIKAKEEDKATCNSVVVVSTVTNQLARLSPLPDVVNEQKTMGIVRERETSNLM